MSAVRDARMLQQAAELARAGRASEASAACGKLLKLNPDHFDACCLQAMLLTRLGDAAGALEMFRRAARLKPDHADARYNLAFALTLAGDHAGALTEYEAALRIDPRQLNALNNAANTLKTLGRDADALEKYRRILQINPNQPEARHNLAVTLHALGRHEESLAASEFVLKLRPDHADSWLNHGNALLDLDQQAEALESYDRAIALRPGFAEAHGNRGNILLKLDRADEALGSFETAIALRPDYAEAHMKRGAALLDAGRAEEALASQDAALALKPDLALALCHRGQALGALRRFEEAAESLEAAIGIAPGLVEAHDNLGVVLAALGEPEAALACHDKAIALAPDVAISHANKANALRDIGRFAEAAESFDAAARLAPDLGFVAGDALVSRLHLCDWTDYAGRASRIEADILRGLPASAPFPTLLFSRSRAVQREAARLRATRLAPVSPPLPAAPKRERVRLGYFSADFHDHATTALLAGVLEHHNRAKFEVFAWSFGPDATDAGRARVVAAVDHFIEARDLGDAEIVRRAREQEIDIAIDLKGYTQFERPGLFARRVAPTQVNYLGYPGTMGAEFMDYIVADATIIPEAHFADYAEKVVWLPHSYQPNDRTRAISARAFTRAECGLPEAGFVFCCFNNAFKIAPETFAIWARVLSRVDGSALWLFVENEAARANLRREAAARGLDPARLVFAGRLPADEHLARLRLADLSLDTLPYNAHTTASDALWAGVPVLTLIGETFAGRVAASLLEAAGLPEMIAASAEEYEDIAVALARDTEMLGAARQILAETRLTTPLFDTALYTRHFEAACEAMRERALAGLPPEHISVPA